MLYTAESIYKEFPRSRFQLKVPSLQLSEGSITGVVGENGNGKTTLLNIIAGKLAASGRFSYFGNATYSGIDWSAIKDKIAFIPQRIPRWYGTLIQNLKLQAAIEKIPASEIDDYLDEILDFLDLQKFKELHWSEISTGFRLRFELARVLIGKPNLLVLDEPLANLDINTQQKFLSDLKNVLKDKEYPTAVVLSSQQLHEIETVANQMVFLRDGTAIFSGETVELESQSTYAVVELQMHDDQAFESFLETQSLAFKKRGEYYQIQLEGEHDISSFIGSMLEAQLIPIYFRDISRSTKRLFHD
ncbi:MAG: ABC transporter ATP-binding protein [Bacteroidia bacterium]